MEIFEGLRFKIFNKYSIKTKEYWIESIENNKCEIGWENKHHSSSYSLNSVKDNF